jgi:hypothetical protein
LTDLSIVTLAPELTASRPLEITRSPGWRPPVTTCIALRAIDGDLHLPGLALGIDHVDERIGVDVALDAVLRDQIAGLGSAVRTLARTYMPGSSRCCGLGKIMPVPGSTLTSENASLPLIS